MDGGALKMDGPGVTQEQRGFNVEIKACYFRPQGSFFLFFSFSSFLGLALLLSLPPPSPSSPPHASSLLCRGWCQGAIEGRQCVLNSDQSREREAFLMTGIHSPFLIHLSSFLLSFTRLSLSGHW